MQLAVIDDLIEQQKAIITNTPTIKTRIVPIRFLLIVQKSASYQQKIMKRSTASVGAKTMIKRN